MKYEPSGLDDILSSLQLWSGGATSLRDAWQLERIMDSVPALIAYVDTEGRYKWVNQEYRNWYGLDSGELVGRVALDVLRERVGPEYAEQLRPHVAEALAGREVTFEATHCFGGRRQDLLLRYRPDVGPDGRVHGFVLLATNQTEQRQVRRDLEQSEQRYKLLFEDNPIPMYTYDTRTLRIRSVNDQMVERYGYTRAELLGMKVSEIRPEEDVEPLMRSFQAPPEGSPIGPVRHRRKDGTYFWVEVTCHTLSEGDPDVWLVVAQDVSEQVRLHDELLRRVNYDSLTGLPTRRLLVEHFERAVTRARETGQRIAVLAIDFDRFKQVNDTFGHRIGDEFLRVSAQKLLRILPPWDTLARVGGDEFAILADCLDSDAECLQVADRLVETLSEPIKLEDLTLQSSISVGLAFYPDHGEDFEEIHRCADFGLYQAKRSGGACWSRYSESEALGIAQALEIEHSLREAVRVGGFELHYQPIISSARDLVKMEALIRLPHPKLGLLLPNRFISVAEESGLVVPMGLWGLREACGQLRKWRDAGLRVAPVAVNVSAAQFRRGNLASDITAILEEFGVDPELLEIELTESLLMENTEHSWQQLRLLKGAGVCIAVDDFGTGYSSLSYLHRLPLDRLKIDGSFVREMIGGGTKPIVRAILELGKALGLSVIAEGVETEEQFRELTEMGCDLLQGFLFSKPKPAAEIEHFLMRNSAVASPVVSSQLKAISGSLSPKHQPSS